jgi:hypothetical protein
MHQFPRLKNCGWADYAPVPQAEELDGQIMHQFPMLKNCGWADYAPVPQAEEPWMGRLIVSGLMTMTSPSLLTAELRCDSRALARSLLPPRTQNSLDS